MYNTDEIIDLEIDKMIREGEQKDAVDSEIDRMIDKEESSNIQQPEFSKEDVEGMDVMADMLKELAEESNEVTTIREIVESENEEVLEDEEVLADLVVDNTTGAVINVKEVDESDDTPAPSLTELIDSYQPTSLPVLDEELKKTFKNDMNLSDEDVTQLLSVVHRHKNGEKFSEYNALPDSVKEIVKHAAAELGLTTRDQISFFAKTMIDQFIQDANFDKELVDFEKSLQAELNIPSLLDLHSEYTRDAMEKELLEKADKLEEDGHVDKADALRRVSAAFTSSYTYDKVYKTLETNRKVRSKLAKDVENYNKFCREFVHKYQDTEFNIHDISLCANILKRAFPGRTDDEIIMFVNCIWKSMENLDTKILENNIYAYYVIKNIMTLDYTEAEAKTDFTQTIIKNIDEVMDKINEYVAEKAERLAAIEADKKAKKGGRK